LCLTKLTKVCSLRFTKTKTALGFQFIVSTCFCDVVRTPSTKKKKLRNKVSEAERKIICIVTTNNKTFPDMCWRKNSKKILGKKFFSGKQIALSLYSSDILIRSSLPCWRKEERNKKEERKRRKWKVVKERERRREDRRRV
jgi:hypothetical protein